jgi:hypothetical protein
LPNSLAHLRALAREAKILVRHRAKLAALSVTMGVAAPLCATVLTASPARSAIGQHGQVAVAQPVFAAAPTDAPSPFPAAGNNAITGPVHLPLFGGAEPSGPAPAPRPGSRLLVPSVGLQVGLVDYTDCSGNAPMTRVSAVHYTCTPAAVTQFVGHNPGVFTPMLNTHAGDRLVYQHDGVEVDYILGAERRVSPAEAAAASQDGSYTHAVIATCAEPDSSAYWIFTATPVGGSSGGTTASRPGQPSSSGSGSRPAPAPSPSPKGGGAPAGNLPPVALPSPPPPPI